MFQLRKVRVEELASFGIRRVVRVRHVRKQKVKQRIFAGVNEFAFGIAPFAVIFVESTVNFAANHRIVAEGHAAALAKELAWGTEKRVDGNVEFFRQNFEHFCVRLRFPCFPAANGLAGDVHAFCKLFLSEVVLFSEALEDFWDGHIISFIDASNIRLPQQKSKKQAVAFCKKVMSRE